MTYQEVTALVASVGPPYAYEHFPEDDPRNPAPAPPFLCYFYAGDNDFPADNVNYQRIRPVTIELYTDNKDFVLEARVEAALNAAGLVYGREETYIDSERLFLVTYTADIIITGGENNA